MGGRQALTTWQGIDLAAKTDAFLTTLRSEAKTNLLGARGHAERVQPRLEVGGRWDSGTAEQGLGLELGGGAGIHADGVGPERRHAGAVSAGSRGQGV